MVFQPCYPTPRDQCSWKGGRAFALAPSAYAVVSHPPRISFSLALPLFLASLSVFLDGSRRFSPVPLTLSRCCCTDTRGWNARDSTGQGHSERSTLTRLNRRRYRYRRCQSRAARGVPRGRVTEPLPSALDYRSTGRERPLEILKNPRHPREDRSLPSSTSERGAGSRPIDRGPDSRGRHASSREGEGQTWGSGVEGARVSLARCRASSPAWRSRGTRVLSLIAFLPPPPRPTFAAREIVNRAVKLARSVTGRKR